MLVKFVTAALLACTSFASGAYISKTPPLKTPWTDKVDINNPHPEYPRPQLVRSQWMSINGLWEFAASDQVTTPPIGKTLNETILVPFPTQSSISGIMRHEPYSFYRRQFTVPTAWFGKQVILNFGAVTWEATVWINGKEIGKHSGGYDPFSFDITAHLKRTGNNEIIVGVYSPLDTTGIPLGKQRVKPYSIYYNGATGIWQTVWLEPTTKGRITQLDTTPDVPGDALNLDIKTSGAPGQIFNAIVLSGSKTIVGTATGIVGKPLRISIKNARLWSPDDPFLYDLRVTLSGGDTVTGYFGMRSVGTAFVNGWLRPVLNGRFYFMMGTLDQGYWPDGIYTAPTDEALRFDLEKQKELGFNTVRKHIKVEPARWHYYCDKIGLLVIQDMPCMRNEVVPSPADYPIFESELERMINYLRGSTSIVQWVPFNEGWGEYDEVRITNWTESLDRTRPVNGNSGSNCCGRDPGVGGIVDDHIYVGPGLTQKPSDTRFAQLGEFGGIGLRVPEHEWQPGAGFSYEMVNDPAGLNRRYVEVTSTLQGLVWGRGLSGSIYTEPTDVENELNGYYRRVYDRQVFKGDFAMFKASHAVIQNGAAWLRDGEAVSLGLTSARDRYISYKDSVAVSSTISDDTSRKATTFIVRKGLADTKCVSFESLGVPGSYLRQSKLTVRLEPLATAITFKGDATFCLRNPRTNSGVAFESFSQKNKYLRAFDGGIYLAGKGGVNKWEKAASWETDVSWVVASPWWRSSADLAVGTNISLQVTANNATSLYLRHKDSRAVISELSASSDELSRSDATFTVRAGLADPSCYSFESLNFPGRFLRHGNFAISTGSGNDEVFRFDATFCARTGSSGSGVSLWSYNIGGHAMRIYKNEVWLAMNAGPKEYDAAAGYVADTTWNISAPLMG